MEYTKDLLNALTDFIDDTKWQVVGSSDDLKKRTCTKLHVDFEEEDEMSMQQDDVLLIWIKNTDQFFAMDCSCPHEGGPLDLGDIEEIDGNLSIICPWHAYDFNIQTGKSTMGLMTSIYETKVVDGNLYIKHDYKLSLKSKRLEVASDKSNGSSTNHIMQEDRPAFTISSMAKEILSTSDPMKKASLTRQAYKNLLKGKIEFIGDDVMPSQPSRNSNLEVTEPGKIKRGRGGTLQSRIALLHSAANIELWAIDLSWDIIGRFSQYKLNDQVDLPKEFFHDFVKVADDEAKHFTLINERLNELGNSFGDLPVHNGLWQSADETKEDILARLAIVHMVHEARGLDVHPKTKQRFSCQGDTLSVELMDIIYEDEITHVACGMKWFTYICNQSVPSLDPVTTFHKLVKKHFKGYLKPPFNTDGRNIAGMDEKWYAPLVKPSVNITRERIAGN